MAREELTLRAQFAQLLGGMFSLDGKFWRSFVLLARKPGFLAHEYCRGARVRFMRPVQLFLVANLIYFVLQPFTGFNSFRSSLHLQIERQPYSALVKPFVLGELASTGESMESYAARFDAHTDDWARTLLLLLVPAFAFGLALLDFRRTRTVVEHLVLSSHFVAFALVYVYVIGLGALVAVRDRSLHLNVEFVSTLVGQSAMFTWWIFALRRFFGWSWRRTVPSALVLSALAVATVVCYRFVLFWIGFWST